MSYREPDPFYKYDTYSSFSVRCDICYKQLTHPAYFSSKNDLHAEFNPLMQWLGLSWKQKRLINENQIVFYSCSTECENNLYFTWIEDYWFHRNKGRLKGYNIEWLRGFKRWINIL